MTPDIELHLVDAANWRACADLEVAAEQRDFVSPVTRYLCLCHYGGLWQPLAVYAADEVVGFVMWAVEPGDRSGWIGGLVIDKARQRKGYGRATVEALARRLLDSGDCDSCALSYSPHNAVARDLYLSLGFVETGEMEDDEVVARLSPAGR
ncbi:MAG: GNAT family N-acetyltransferase [Actinobacteria bacterium]|nr:GNAT family N-acetyltransferase [Actinomycetota bacterium]